MCGILIDVCHTAAGNNKWCKNASINVTLSLNGSVQVQADLLMSGSLTSRGPKKVFVFFHTTIGIRQSRYDTPPGVRLWEAGQMLPAGTLEGRASGSLGAFVYWPCSDGEERIQMDNAVSFISSSQARKNLNRLVASGLTFSQQQALTESMWASRISIVEIADSRNTSETQILMKKFYTALYHANLAPSIYDEDGAYLSFNEGKSVLRVSDEADHAYTDMSIWDIHRTQLPWLSLTAPSVLKDILHSLQRMSMEGTGDIPRWPIANIYGECMIGSHAFVSIADAVQKGQTSTIDVKKLYESMKRTATVPRPRAGRACVDNYTTLGFVPDSVVPNLHSSALTAL